MTNKEIVRKLGVFLSLTPPIVHSRDSYKSPCHKGCKACEYLKAREEILEMFLLVYREEPNL